MKEERVSQEEELLFLPVGLSVLSSVCCTPLPCPEQCLDATWCLQVTDVLHLHPASPEGHDSGKGADETHVSGAPTDKPSGAEEGRNTEERTKVGSELFSRHRGAPISDAVACSNERGIVSEGMKSGVHLLT